MRFLKDPRFWGAMAAGPVFWLAFWAVTSPDLEPRRPLREPGTFLILSLVYPVLEELVFRGLLQGRLFAPRLGGHRFYGISLANLLASLCFVAAHFARPPLWALSVFFPSLIFGYFYDRYASVVPSMVLHIFYNTGFFLLFWG